MLRFFEEREGPRLIQQKTGGVALSSTWQFSMYGCRDRIASFIGQKETEDGGSREMVVLWVRKSGRFLVDLRVTSN